MDLVGQTLEAIGGFQKLFFCIAKRTNRAIKNFKLKQTFLEAFLILDIFLSFCGEKERFPVSSLIRAYRSHQRLLERTPQILLPCLRAV